MQGVAKFFVHNVRHFTTQAVGNTLWGCAVLNFYDQDMFNVASLEVQRKQKSELHLHAPHRFAMAARAVLQCLAHLACHARWTQHHTQ
jgi:hypothetical protein